MRLSRTPTPLLRLRSDDQLVAAFRDGRDDAFTEIAERYRERLVAYASHMLRSLGPAAAEDVVQDVLIRAYRALRADGRPMALRAWLYRIAHNRCLDELRAERPTSELHDGLAAATEDPVATFGRRERLRELVVDIQGLPPQQRSALVIRELDGLSYAELAEALDTTVPAVKSLLVRARMNLAAAAEAREPDYAGESARPTSIAMASA
ncbi:MAG TPA: sigma-70 family RNA polymerase sigma factor [Solirubrobacteraceae bacterium]|nr:sigma-70 family RNA polymerase sigma factor [Solirubrobacteraceae bacterium]